MTSPIGIFDSGLGGLSVARELLQALPAEQIIYFADNAHVPYGERPFEEVRRFACAITDFLVNQGAKAVVMACNMSSAIALDAARAMHPDIPVLGVIEPGTRAALQVSKGFTVGVLATTGTVKSEAYVRSLKQRQTDCVVAQQACPRFVPLVESGNADSEDAEAAARQYIDPLLRAGCRTVILGCTHYPFLLKQISMAAGEGIAVVDPAFETVRELKQILERTNKLASEKTGEDIYYTSADTTAFEELGSIFMGKDNLRLAQAIWVNSADTNDFGTLMQKQQVTRELEKL